MIRKAEVIRSRESRQRITLKKKKEINGTQTDQLGIKLKAKKVQAITTLIGFSLLLL
jgi:hypothetical protein